MYYANTVFGNSVNFKGSSFNGNADFYGMYPDGIADFGIPSFNGVANFPYSSFNGDADFRGSSFNGTSVFVSSNFNNSDFSKAQFSKTTSFDDARFDKSTSFNSSLFKGDALFEGAVFDGTLYLNRAKYDRLYIRWKNIKELGYDDAAYLALLENFKKLGYLEDYDGCYYEYRKAHRGQDWSGKYHAMLPAEEWLGKNIFDFWLEKFYGYGKKPIWPLGWSALTILLFGAFWLIGGLKRDNGENHRGIFDALLFSATLFLSGTKLFVDPPQMPQISRLSPSWTRLAFILERVLGAFFSILFFLAISGTVVR
jgi:hypothetical protein